MLVSCFTHLKIAVVPVTRYNSHLISVNLRLGKCLNSFLYFFRICSKLYQNLSCNPYAKPVEVDQCINKCNTEQYPRQKSSYIDTLIRSQKLQKSVNQHRKHHKHHYVKLRNSNTDCNWYPCNHANQFTGTARTDRKLLSSEEKRAIRPRMASEKNL